MLIGLTLTTPAWPAQPNSLSPLLNNSPLSDAELQRRAAIDEDAADYLLHIDDWPIDVRAIELVRELCERTVATRLG